MQCQFGAFLRDSLIFLLGDIKVYNIFRVLFWLSPQLTTLQGLAGRRRQSSSVGGEGGMFGFALLPPFLTMLPLLPIPWAVCICVSAYSRT